MDVGELYNVLGEDRIRGMVRAFYARVPDDSLLGPMYPAHDLEGAEKRLADFLIFRLGGPQTYIEERGHPRLRMRHMPFAVTPAARDRWMTLMAAAVDQSCGGPELAPVREALVGFFASVAEHMINRPG